MRAWCEACQNRVPLVTVDEAARFAQVSSRTIYRWVEDEKLHSAETSDARLLICRESIPPIGESPSPILRPGNKEEGKMKTQTKWIDRFRRRLPMAALIVVALCASAKAQSTDRDNPTPLSSNEIRGTGIDKGVEYFYTFLAGPGELVLTTDVRAKAYSTFFETLLFNMDARELGVIRYGPTMRSERRMTRIQLGQQQPVLIQIALDSSAGEYMVRISGAAQLETAATLSATPVAADAGGAIPVAAADASAATGTPVTTGESETTATPTDPTADAGGKPSKAQKIWMRLGAASELLGLSNIGKLKIDMKDGTSQEIGLMKIKKLFAPKGDEPNSTTPMNDSWQRLWMKLGGAGELMNLAGSGAMRLEMQDGTQQQFDLSKIKKVSLKK